MILCIIIYYVNWDIGRGQKLEVDEFHLIFFELNNASFPFKFSLGNLKNLHEGSVSQKFDYI